MMYRLIRKDKAVDSIHVGVMSKYQVNHMIIGYNDKMKQLLLMKTIQCMEECYPEDY